MIPAQSQSSSLVGMPRDYPPPPKATPEQLQWWSRMQELFRQQDTELQALRDAVNALPKK